MVIDIIANMIVRKRLYSHNETYDCYSRQGKGKVKFPHYFWYYVGTENRSENLDKTNKDLIEIYIYSEFVEA